jgi:transposase
MDKSTLQSIKILSLESLNFVDYHQILQGSLSIVEATGGYEGLLIDAIITQGFKVHRANTKKVKNFIRSFGNDAKTDSLDAKALAKYGFDRHDQLELYQLCSEINKELFQLVQRRSDIKSMLVAEKNRLKNPSLNSVVTSIIKIINILEQELQEISDKIGQIIYSGQQLSVRVETLKTIPGIGKIVAIELITLLPELGKLCRRKIASLAGLAPKANDSGKFKGYRKIANGRNIVKPILFLAAMAARNS